jgi:O-antigen/teichoic acid export membrane protein
MSRGNAKSLFAEIIRRSAWVTLGSVLGRALPILASMLLSRTLGLQKFAIVGIVMTWASIVPSLTTWGIGLVATQTVARYGSASYRIVFRWSIFSAACALVVLHGLLLLCGSGWITVLYPQIQMTEIGPGVLAIGIASSFFVLIQAFLNGAHRPKTLSLLLALSGLLQGVALFVAGIQKDVEHLVTYVLAAFLFNVGASYVLLRPILREHSEVSGPDFITFKSWLRQILPSIGASAAVAPVAFVCASMLANETDGMRQLGAFFALEQLSMLLTYVPSLVVQSTVPVLASLVVEDKNKAFHYVRKMAGYQVAVLAVLIFAAVLSAQFVLTLYGQLVDFRSAYLVMLLNVFITVPLATLGAYIQATGRFSLGSTLNLTWAAVFVLGSYYLQKFGCTGIQVARLLATCVLGFGTAAVFYRVLRQEKNTEYGQARC